MRATVSLKELLEAAGKLPKMKRSPNGSRGKIPKTTELTVATGTLLISTPVIETEIKASNTYVGKMAVDSFRLLEVLRVLERTDGAHDGAIEIHGANRSLLIYGKSRHEIPV